MTTTELKAVPLRRSAPEGFDANPMRGRFNSAFFSVMRGYINFEMRSGKRRAFADLPPDVVEIGSGAGANMRFLAEGTRLTAIEPNPYMHARLRRSARRRGVALDIRSLVAERIELPDASTDAVISSLTLCTVSDPTVVLSEIRRILRPGGRFSFAEHVVAKPHSFTRWTQRAFRRPWAWVFEGCSCERDLTRVIESAGFAQVDIQPYRIHSSFIPFNTHIAGTAIK